MTDDLSWLDNDDLRALNEEAGGLGADAYRIIAQAQIATAARLTGIANILVDIRNLLAEANE